eukprot:tig00000889_g5316.t1
MSIPSELVEDLAKAREMWAKSRDWPTREMEKRARKLGYLYQAHSGEGFHTINLNFAIVRNTENRQIAMLAETNARKAEMFDQAAQALRLGQ